MEGYPEQSEGTQGIPKNSEIFHYVQNDNTANNCVLVILSKAKELKESQKTVRFFTTFKMTRP